jgi:hypothetical protein
VDATEASKAILTHSIVASKQRYNERTGTVRRLRRNEHAGGCGVCEPPNITGTRAHTLLTQSFYNTYRDVEPEQIFENPRDNENGRLDLMQIRWEQTPPHTISIGEIKPDNDKGRRDGKRDLDYYRRAVQRSLPLPMFTVEFLDIPAPGIPLKYKDPLAKESCVQSLSLRRTKIGGQTGLYLYSCLPPRSKLPKDCCVPDPDPVVVPSTKSSNAEENNEEKELQPDGVPQPEPTPVAAKSVVEQVMDFVVQVIATGANAEKAALDFLAVHPELVDALQAAAVTAIAVTIIQDIATSGIGLIDDPLVISMCVKLIQVARAVKSGSLVLALP